MMNSLEKLESQAVVKGSRNVAIDVAKGLSIVLVVFWHVIMVSKVVGFSIDPIYNSINKPLMFIRMPLFFFVSGILISKYLSSTWHTYLNKNLINIAYLYILWTILYTIVQRRAVSGIFTALYSPEIHLWFLWALIIYRATIYISASKRKLIFVAMIPISIAAYFEYPSQLFEILTKHQISTVKYSIFFYFGALFGTSVISYVESRKIIVTVSMIALAALSLATNFLFGLSVFGLFAFLGLSSLIAKYLTRIRDLLTYFGSRSLEIFILHFALVGPLGRLAGRLPHSDLWGVPVVTAAAVLISIAARRASDKFAPWLFVMPDRLRKPLVARLS